MSYFKVFGLTHILWWPRHLGAKWADGTIGVSVCYMQSLMVSRAHIKTCICLFLQRFQRLCPTVLRYLSEESQNILHNEKVHIEFIQSCLTITCIDFHQILNFLLNGGKVC